MENNVLKGDFLVNGKDAWDEYHVCLQQGSKINLMAPPAFKSIITNESRNADGKEYITKYAKADERQFTLSLACVAKDGESVYETLGAFTSVIASKDEIVLGGSGIQNVTCYYKSMSGISEFNGEIAMFAVTFVEPNPTNRV